MQIIKSQKKSPFIIARVSASPVNGGLSSALVDSILTQMEMCTHVYEHNIQNEDLGYAWIVL